MSGRRRPALAILLFFAFTTPLGIAAHLISEFAGLGWHDDADLAFSARHGYLALLAIVSLAAFAIVLRSVPRATRHYHVGLIVRSLPLGGRGPLFLGLSFVAQFGFFALTQIGEGCPLCGGDVFTGVLAAGFAAVLGALAVTLCKRRVLEFAIALVTVFAAARVAGGVPSGVATYRGPTATAPRRSPFSFRYRPPPLAA
jgi:hypothetical protein